ncbi:MAG: HPr family phosphocarrier protein [Verrucomicrobiota bacterium]
MNERLARKLTILNKYGIYARSSALLVKTAAKAGPNTEVTVTCEGTTVSCKSIMGLLTIEGYQGRELLVEARGPEARAVLEAITELVNLGFLSGEPCLPIPPSHSEFVDLSAEPEQA